MTLIKDFLYPDKILSLPELSSDHNLILQNFNIKYTYQKIEGNLKTNWNLYINILTNYDEINTTDIYTPDQLDKIVVELKMPITEAKLRI